MIILTILDVDYSNTISFLIQINQYPCPDTPTPNWSQAIGVRSQEIYEKYTGTLFCNSAGLQRKR